jgi:hypothetical protein
MLNLDPTLKFMKRHRGSPVTTILDIADYKRGYVFSIPFLTIMKIKTSTIMESPKYMTLIKIFGTEYVKA